MGWTHAPCEGLSQQDHAVSLHFSLPAVCNGDTLHGLQERYEPLGPRAPLKVPPLYSQHPAEIAALHATEKSCLAPDCRELLP